jgi:hypothetical protein
MLDLKFVGQATDLFLHRFDLIILYFIDLLLVIKEPNELICMEISDSFLDKFWIKKDKFWISSDKFWINLGAFEFPCVDYNW